MNGGCERTWLGTGWRGVNGRGGGVLLRYQWLRGRLVYVNRILGRFLLTDLVFLTDVAGSDATSKSNCADCHSKGFEVAG